VRSSPRQLGDKWLPAWESAPQHRWKEIHWNTSAREGAFCQVSHGCIAVTLVDVRERVIGEIRGHRSLDRNVTVAFRAVTRNSLTYSARGSYCREAVGIADLIGSRAVFPLFHSPPIKEFCQAVNITALPCPVDIFPSFNITINVISPLFHYSGSDFISGPLFQNCSPPIFFTGFERQAAIVALKDYLPDKLSDPSPFRNHIKRPVL